MSDDEGIDTNLFDEPASYRPKSPPPTSKTYRRGGGKEVDVRLVGGHPLWGHVLYPAAIGLSRFLEQHATTLLKFQLKGSSVLELGAGGGLPGLVAVLEGAGKVVTTDFPDPALVSNLEWNSEENLEASEQSRLVVEGFTWGTPPIKLLEHLPPGSKGFDVILMSDLVFNHSQHAALLASCEACLAPSSSAPSPQTHTTEDDTVSATALSYLQTPVALAFYSHHRPQFVDADIGFVQMARERGWRCRKVVEDRDAGCAFPEDQGDPAVRGTVHGWALTR